MSNLFVFGSFAVIKTELDAGAGRFLKAGDIVEITDESLYNGNK